MAEKFLVRNGDEDITFELRRADGGRIELRREQEEHWMACDLERVGGTELYLLMIDNRPTELYMERRRGGALVTIGRHTFDCDVGPWRPPSSRARAGGGAQGIVKVVAPMTGSIVEVRCEVGAIVAAGEVVLVIESMKMNNELRSPAAGTVESVPVSAGQRVKAHDLLVAIRTASA